MRTIDYEEWKRRRQARFAAAVKAEDRVGGRKPGNRPRDPEKERVLIRLERARRQRLLASGKLRIVGPRLWEWRTDVRADG